MILDALIKIKRQSIIISILLMCLGIVMIGCPEKFVSSLIMISGYVMVIYAMEKTLEFLGGSGSIMQSISFVIAIIVGMVGLAVLVFNDNILSVLSWIFGAILILEGGNDFYYAFTFARRSGRSGWSILVIFALILIAAGAGLIIGQIYTSFAAFKTAPSLMKTIGVALIIASVISALKLVWISPAKNGGDENGED